MKMICGNAPKSVMTFENICGEARLFDVTSVEEAGAEWEGVTTQTGGFEKFEDVKERFAKRTDFWCGQEVSTSQLTAMM